MIPQKPSTNPLERVALSVLGVVATQRVKIRAADPTLLMTIEASVAQVSSRDPDLTLDRSGFIIVPRGGHVTLRAATLACRVVVLSFHEPLLAIVASTYKKLGFERGQLDRWFARMEVLPRTVWIHEIVHRYVFERHGLGEDDNVATRFLETEILKEVYFLFRDRDAGADRATMVRKYSAYIERSVAYVDAHVFEPCSVADLAEFAGASASTLLRAFRRELGCSPGAYWRSRKLDEALLLLRAGCYGVAEVATAVGYENPTAFAHAFRVRFGCPPSKFLPRRHP